MTTSHPTLDLQRFPIGRYQRPEQSTAEDRLAAVEVLRELPSALSRAVDGLSDVQLDTPYRDGGWTVRQLVHHVADSHLNAYTRFRLALTEDWPTIKPYHEAQWAELSDARTAPVALSLDLLKSLHARWVLLLEAMTDEDFARGYTHPDGGSQPLERVLALYAWHSRHHTAHALVLRKAKNW